MAASMNTSSKTTHDEMVPVKRKSKFGGEAKFEYKPLTLSESPELAKFHSADAEEKRSGYKNYPHSFTFMDLNVSLVG